MLSDETMERAPLGAVPSASLQKDAPRDVSRSLAVRRAAVIGITVGLLAIVGICCWQYLPGLYAWLIDAEAVHAFVDEHAVLSRLAMVGINMLQIFLAFLPGEPVELASGYAFGFWEGTALCLVASAIGSSIIYAVVRRWGWNVVGLFFDRSHLERFSWLQHTRRVELVMLIVFLIPGTPKDFLTYFAGLVGVRFPAMLAIATIGRVPSIITSTIAASAFGSGDYTVAIIAVIAAGLLIVGGTVAYKQVEARCKR